MSAMQAVNAFVTTLYLGLLLVAARSDLAEFRIPNRLNLAIALLYPAHVLAAPAAVPWAVAIGIAMATLLAGLLPFRFGWIGGGDVKLLAAAALWAGPSGYPVLLIGTALAGGLMALAMLPPMRVGFAWACHTVGAVDARDAILGKTMPYGIAIAIGGTAAALTAAG